MISNPIVKAQLAAFAEDNSVIDWEEDVQFELYAIHCICNGSLFEQLDPFDVHLTDSEFGLDGAAILIQGDVFSEAAEAVEFLENTKRSEADFIFVQSKTSAGFDYGDISKFLDAVAEFFTETEPGSERLKELAHTKDAVFANASNLSRNPSLQCFYATTGSYDKPARIESLIRARKRQLEKQICSLT